MSFTMKYDAQKNRINVTAIEMTLESADDYIRQFNEIAKQVKPGFTGITDLTDGKILTPEVSGKLAVTGETAQKAGVKDWVYVTNSPIYKLQMKRLFGEFAKHYDTYAEAAAYLDSL